MLSHPDPLVTTKNGRLTNAVTFLEQDLLFGEAVTQSLVNSAWAACVRGVGTQSAIHTGILNPL